MDTLIHHAWSMYHEADNRVVKPSIPVLYFGDYERYARSPLKVVTVGKNPSGNEFPGFDRFHRFAKARGIYPDILGGKFYAEYLDALNSYFQTGTQLDWFDRSYEPVLRGAGWSFYNSGQSVALHTDICTPLATCKPWKDVDRELKKRLELTGNELWHRLVSYLDPDIIIASIATEHRQKIVPLRLHFWDDLYTVERSNPYTVKMTALQLSSGKQSMVVHGRDAVRPFQPVSDREKERIGAAIRQQIAGYNARTQVSQRSEACKGEESMPMRKASKSSPLTKSEFHAWLRSWLGQGENRIDGGSRDYGGSAWVYIRDGGKVYRLNADTKRRGVEDYLRLVEQHGDDLAWFIRPNAGKDNTLPT